ncbi:unnamed protein product [Calypogeia fissa]
MPQFYDSINEELQEWALKQSVFFTASAPLAGKHVNLSPKGLPASSFSILSPNQAAYIDATGSGSETIAHLYENGRITIMFCSFDAGPRILRFFCTGKVVEWNQQEFEILLTKVGDNKRIAGARAVILLDVFKVQTSCGFGVPRLSIRKLDDKMGDIAFDKEGENENWVAGFEDRETLGHWASKKVEKKQLQAYQQEWNSDSLDGLTGLRAARRGRGDILWYTDLRASLRRILAQREAVAFGFCVASVLYASHIAWWKLFC